METKTVTLKEVLEFRDWKAAVQNNMLVQDKAGIVVSLGMNIPGPVKCSSSILTAFREGMRCLEKMLTRLQGTILKAETAESNAGCTAIYLIKNIDQYLLKKEAVALEKTHILGRIFDIDVINQNKEILTREQVGESKRKCLLCENDAKVCGRSRRHTVQELQEKTFEIIEKWRNKISEDIGSKAYKALLDEVYTTPKPGLVDLYSCGAHKDMNAESFEKSAEALRPFFVQMTGQGLCLDCTEKELFKKIRKTGIEAEKAMYKATGGVNTHKGLIFTLGIYCAAAGRCIQQHGKVTEKEIRKIQQEMTREILTDELEMLHHKEAASHGEKNLKMYGTTGIRGEAINGYLPIWEYALPVLHQGLKEGRDYNLTRLQTLFTLMSCTKDSNILARQNPETLLYVQEQAKNFLEKGGVYEPGNYQELYGMDVEYIHKNISPGGSADLLATTIFMEMVLNDNE